MVFKRLSYFFLLVLVVQYFGFALYFQWEKARIKKEIKTALKEGVPEDQLKTFLFLPKDFEQLNWVKPGKEFKIGDRFFDVVRKTKKDGLIQIVAINDIQESQLFRRLSAYVGVNLDHSGDKSPVKLLSEWQFQPIITNDFDAFHWTTLDSANSKHNCPYRFKMKTQVVSLPAPPPEFYFIN